MRRRALFGFLCVAALRVRPSRAAVGPFHWRHVNASPFSKRGGSAARRLEIALRTFADNGVPARACEELRRMVAAGVGDESMILPGFRLRLMMTQRDFERDVIAEVEVAAVRFDVVVPEGRFVFLDPHICDNWCIHFAPPTPPCVPVCSGPCAR